jgi:hypothetical protein
MEIQRGKEGMKTEEFNRSVGATTGCTLRALLSSVPQQATQQKFGIRGDAWFRSIRTANEVRVRGFDGVFQIKQYHASYPY